MFGGYTEDCTTSREATNESWLFSPEDHSWRPPSGDALDKFWRAVAMELKVQPPKRPTGRPSAKPAMI
jgi:hypothetical protein